MFIQYLHLSIFAKIKCNKLKTLARAMGLKQSAKGIGIMAFLSIIIVKTALTYHKGITERMPYRRPQTMSLSRRKWPWKPTWKNSDDFPLRYPSNSGDNFNKMRTLSNRSVWRCKYVSGTTCGRRHLAINVVIYQTSKDDNWRCVWAYKDCFSQHLLSTWPYLHRPRLMSPTATLFNLMESKLIVIIFKSVPGRRPCLMDRRWLMDVAGIVRRTGGTEK